MEVGFRFLLLFTEDTQDRELQYNTLFILFKQVGTFLRGRGVKEEVIERFLSENVSSYIYMTCQFLEHKEQKHCMSEGNCDLKSKTCLFSE